MTPKYEITRIAHPKFSWLHRIRALRQIRPGVFAGDLVGNPAGSFLAEIPFRLDKAARDHVCIGGNAEIFASRVTGEAPVISENASVYGEVRGRVEIHGRTVILPGSKIDNPTTDIFHIYPERIVVKKPFGEKLCVLSPPMAGEGQQKQKSRFPSRWEER